MVRYHPIRKNSDIAFLKLLQYGWKKLHLDFRISPRMRDIYWLLSETLSNCLKILREIYWLDWNSFTVLAENFELWCFKITQNDPESSGTWQFCGFYSMKYKISHIANWATSSTSSGDLAKVTPIDPNEFSQ